MTASSASKALVIAGMNLRRFLRDRGNLFFAFVFPVALVLVIGIQFGGDGTPRLGVAGGDGATAARVLDEVRAGDVEVVRVEGPGDLRRRVESTDLDAGIVLPADLDRQLAAGSSVVVDVVAGTTVPGQRLRSVLDSALARAVAEPTAAHAVAEAGVPPAQARQAARRLAGTSAAIEVEVVTTGDRLFPEGLGQYDVAAPSQLVLFMFVTGLTGAYALIQTRQLGMSRRMRATPTPMRTLLAGEGLGRLAIVLVQGAYVLGFTLLLFGVDWGDPVGAVAVLALFAAVSAGAALLVGSLFSQPEQASGVGVIAGLCIAALGGAMLPIELFSDTLRSVARATPHYWALDAFAELVRHDASVLDVLPQLGVLALFALVLVTLASWRLRAVLSRA